MSFMLTLANLPYISGYLPFSNNNRMGVMPFLLGGPGGGGSGGNGI